ncbi:MAG: hypothetical protein M3P44_09455, partial [Actinomycetota bacterium]|nr:hypothetical protein [Actinomycetota bacterium]
RSPLGHRRRSSLSAECRTEPLEDRERVLWMPGLRDTAVLEVVNVGAELDPPAGREDAHELTRVHASVGRPHGDLG